MLEKNRKFQKNIEFDVDKINIYAIIIVIKKSRSRLKKRGCHGFNFTAGEQATKGLSA